MGDKNTDSWKQDMKKKKTVHKSSYLWLIWDTRKGIKITYMQNIMIQVQ